MKYLIAFVLLSFALASCSIDCQTCKIAVPDQIITEEYCDDGETTYTDQFGAFITFEAFIIQHEAIGYDCK